MTRETVNQNRVALLATGDEIINGDILNTNSRDIAEKLFNQGIQLGLHVVAPDAISEIEQSIQFLLNSHRALIMTGGLGPTSDDITRYALSKAINKPLVFDNATWESICQRLKKLGYDTPPETNRQQALFPEDAVIIPNPHGTAAGCFINYNDKLIYMLPGPPSECLPIVDNFVLPQLLISGFQQTLYHDRWLLFGVSEGQIAEELDKIAAPFQCTTGYRLNYPYIEFKLQSHHADDFAKLQPIIEHIIRPYLIGNGKFTASSVLKEYVSETAKPLRIHDLATGGLLEHTIKTPKTEKFLSFAAENPDVVISGLTEYWHTQQDKPITELKITFQNHEIKTMIPFRGSRVKLYAVEYICKEMLKMIQANQNLNENK